MWEAVRCNAFVFHQVRHDNRETKERDVSLAHSVVGRVFPSVALLEMSHREDQNWLDGFLHEDSVCIGRRMRK